MFNAFHGSRRLILPWEYSGIASSLGHKSRYSRNFETRRTLCRKVLEANGIGVEAMKDILILLHSDLPDLDIAQVLASHPNLGRRLEALDSLKGEGWERRNRAVLPKPALPVLISRGKRSSGGFIYDPTSTWASCNPEISMSVKKVGILTAGGLPLFIFRYWRTHPAVFGDRA